MNSLKYDIGHECYFVDCGYFRIEYILEEDDGYHYEIFFDGEMVSAVYPAHGVWTLDEAVESSKSEVDEIMKDIIGLVNELSCLDMDEVKEASAIIREEE